MHKNDSQEQKISIAMPATGFRRVMYFNRFFLQNVDDHRLAYFGLVDESSMLRDVYACLITRTAIDRHREGLLTFLGRLGSVSMMKKQWVPPPTPMQIDSVTIISMGNSELGEILLSNFAIGPAMAWNKTTGKPVTTEALAFLQCDIELQKLLITELYASGN